MRIDNNLNSMVASELQINEMATNIARVANTVADPQFQEVSADLIDSIVNQIPEVISYSANAKSIENTKCNFWYVIKYKGLYKIGITIGTVKFRYRSDLVGDTNIEILYEKQFDTYPEALDFETTLKDKYQKYRYYGKRIFRNTGNTEVFKENIFELYLKEL